MFSLLYIEQKWGQDVLIEVHEFSDPVREYVLVLYPAPWHVLGTDFPHYLPDVGWTRSSRGPPWGLLWSLHSDRGPSVSWLRLTGTYHFSCWGTATAASDPLPRCVSTPSLHHSNSRSSISSRTYRLELRLVHMHEKHYPEPEPRCAPSLNQREHAALS